MNKELRINEFFNIFKDLKNQNPGIQFNHNLIYSSLIRLGVFSNPKNIISRNPAFEQIVKKDGNFSRWVNEFLNKKYTNAYVDPNWNYFCQFECGDIKRNNDGEFIKIYVPMINSHIFEGVNRLFNFIDKKKINHASKVAADIRFDNVVIRVKRKADADAIINFIKKDAYIQEGLLPPNPFAFNKDGVSLACDGNASYNSILSALLENFINNTDQNYLNCNNFYNYLQRLQQGIINNTIDVKTFILTTFSGSKPSNKDFQRVLSLLINSHNPNFTYDDYLKHFYNGLDNNSMQINNSQSLNIEYVLFDAIKTMNQKYTLDESIVGINKYINSSDPSYITRLNGLRKRIVNSNFINDIKNLLYSSKISFVDLCYKVLNKYQNSYGENYEQKRAKF